MRVQVISFNCVLKNKTGQLISSTYNRDVINAVNGPKTVLDGLARGLQDLKKGDKRLITLSAEEAYGLYEPKKVILFPKSKLPKTVRVGEMITIASKSGHVHTYLVAQIHDYMVSLDGNHPLAGQDLIFEIEAIEARDATPEEIAESVNVVATQMLH